MKFVSWNVNGLRACITKGFFDFFQTIDADFFCIQENKMQQDQAVIETPGYYQYWNCAQRKGYSGTTIFAKKEPLHITTGIYGSYDDEGRVLTLEYPDFYLVNCYSPNVKRELSRLDYRMDFEDCLRNYLSELSSKKTLILCGDLNVAHEEIDLKNPKPNIGNAGFTNEERAKFTELLHAGFVDSFRFQHPEEPDHYSWWSYRFKARERNIGWRIDYFVVSEYAKGKIQNTCIYPEIFGSDHCPIGLEMQF